jgi:glucose-1-phosphatase
MVLPVTVEGLTPNADGLYRLADLDARFAETMAEYDAIEDASTDVRPAARIIPIRNSRSFTLGGTQANDSTSGIVITDNQKVLKK